MTAVMLAAGPAGGAGRELVGALVAGVSALLYDAGYVLEKQALTALPPMRLHPVDLLRTAATSRRWLAGFVAMLAGLGLQVVALTLAPVSVVQPILAGGLIALAAVGSLALGEQLSGRHKLALVLVLVAVAGIAASAHGGGPLDQRVPLGRFAETTAVIAVLAAIAVGGYQAGRGPIRRGPVRRGPVQRGPVGGWYSLVATAAGAGLLYGLGAIAEKAVATRLVGHGMVSGAWSSLGTAFPWLFVIVTLGGMLVFQVGLQAHPASLMASLTNVVSTACALAGAAFVFDESLLPPGWWSGVRVVGLLCVLGAVVVLGAGPDPAPDPAPADHAYQ